MPTFGGFIGAVVGPLLGLSVGGTAVLATLLASASYHARKLVTIITESALERHIVEEVSKFVVNGYTITDVRGTGARGKRATDTFDSGNNRCEVIYKEVAAEPLVARLLAEYGRDYAIVAYVRDVTVLRADKSSVSARFY